MGDELVSRFAAAAGIDAERIRSIKRQARGFCVLVVGELSEEQVRHGVAAIGWPQVNGFGRVMHDGEARPLEWRGRTIRYFCGWLALPDESVVPINDVG